MKGPQEIKTRPTIQEFCFSEYTQGNENSNSVRYLHSHVYYSAIHNSQNMETTQKTTNKWRGKKDLHTECNIFHPWERNISCHWWQHEWTLNILLSKTRQRKTSTVQHHLYVESKEIKCAKKNNNVQENSHQTISWFLNRNSTSQNGKA